LSEKYQKTGFRALEPVWEFFYEIRRFFRPSTSQLSGQTFIIIYFVLKGIVKWWERQRKILAKVQAPDTLAIKLESDGGDTGRYLSQDKSQGVSSICANFLNWLECATLLFTIVMIGMMMCELVGVDLCS
jgi:hypothetical protein